jgi:hypothetical protein
MSQYRTIFINNSYNNILSYLERIGTLELEDDDDDNVRTFEKLFSNGKLKVSLKKQVERGDKFSFMVLGVCNFFENIETKFKNQKQTIINQLLDCETAIGIVADSNFTETDERATFIYNLMQMFDGIMFDGQGMTDKNGKIILDHDGSSEITN